MEQEIKNNLAVMDRWQWAQEVVVLAARAEMALQIAVQLVAQVGAEMQVPVVMVTPTEIPLGAAQVPL